MKRSTFWFINFSTSANIFKFFRTVFTKLDPIKPSDPIILYFALNLGQLNFINKFIFKKLF